MQYQANPITQVIKLAPQNNLFIYTHRFRLRAILASDEAGNIVICGQATNFQLLTHFSSFSRCHNMSAEKKRSILDASFKLIIKSKEIKYKICLAEIIFT